MYVLAVVVCLTRLTDGPHQQFLLELAVGIGFGPFRNLGRDAGLAGAVPAYLGGRKAKGRSSRFLAANPCAEVVEVRHSPNSCTKCK